MRLCTYDQQVALQGGSMRDKLNSQQSRKSTLSGVVKRVRGWVGVISFQRTSHLHWAKYQGAYRHAELLMWRVPHASLSKFFPRGGNLFHSLLKHLLHYYTWNVSMNRMTFTQQTVSIDTSRTNKNADNTRTPMSSSPKPHHRWTRVPLWR